MKQFERVTWLSGGLTMGFRIWWHAVCPSSPQQQHFQTCWLISCHLYGNISHSAVAKKNQAIINGTWMVKGCVTQQVTVFLHEMRQLVMSSQEVCCLHQYWFSHMMQMMWRVNIHRLGVKTKSAFEISIICHLPLFFLFLTEI